MEVLNKLFALVVDKVPNVIAQVLFSVLIFAFQPYRTALLLVRFARLNKVPTPLFTVIALVLFMGAVGFTRPFFTSEALDLRSMTRTFSQLSNTEEHKTDVFFIMLFALGVTSLIGLSQLCIEAVRRGRYPQLFRDLHYVATALNFPWFVAIYLASFFALTHVPVMAAFGGKLMFEHPRAFMVFLFTPLPLCAVLMLWFGLQMDRRWYRARPASRWSRRIVPVYVSAVAILILTPLYLRYLASALYGVQPDLAYRIDCFEQKHVLYATIAVENPTTETKFLNGIEVADLDKKVVIDQSFLFEGLKEDMVVRPKEIRRIRLRIASATAGFSDDFTASFCEIGERLTAGEQRQLTDAEMQLLH